MSSKKDFIKFTRPYVEEFLSKINDRMAEIIPPGDCPDSDLAEANRDIEKLEDEVVLLIQEKQILQKKLDWAIQQRNQIIIGFDTEITWLNKALIEKLDKEIKDVK